MRDRAPQVRRTSVRWRMDVALRGRDQERGGARCGKGRHPKEPPLTYWSKTGETAAHATLNVVVFVTTWGTTTLRGL